MNFSFIKRKITKHKIYFGALLATVIIGFIIGAFFCTFSERLYISGNVVDFYVNALTRGGSLAGMFFAGLFSDIAVLLIFFGCSYVAFIFPLYFIILFYRGYILGLVSGVFLCNFGINGLMLFIFAVMISNLVTSAALATFAACAKDGFKSKCKSVDNERYLCFLVCLAMTLVGAVAELVFLLFVIRPLNFRF